MPFCADNRSYPIRIKLAALLLCFLGGTLRAAPPDPGSGGWPFPTNVLNSWSFTDTNTWASDYGDLPVSFTNLSGSKMGSIGNYSMVLDATNPAWLRLPLVETNGATNLSLKIGTVWFAVAP